MSWAVQSNTQSGDFILGLVFVTNKTKLFSLCIFQNKGRPQPFSAALLCLIHLQEIRNIHCKHQTDYSFLSSLW
jgi:hypothetical protein